MKLRAWLASIFGVVYLCFLALCSLSGPLSSDSPLAFLNSNIYLSSGGFAEDTTELTAVVTAEDLAVLEQFPALRAADLSGSVCYDEIMRWEQAHPGVNVKYTVALPCGVTSDNKSTELDLSAIGDGDIPQLQSALKYLPAVEKVALGGGTEAEHLSYELLSQLVESCPGVDFTYTISVLGQDATLGDASLDLSSMTAGDIENIVALLKCMPKLSTVVLGQEGSFALSLEEISRLVAARPDVSFEYSGKLWGVDYKLSDTVLDLNHIKMDDRGAAVRRVIACMNKLETLDMDYCGVSNEDMASIRDDFPNVDVIWRIWFGTNYSVRTDAVKILASKPSVGGPLDSAAVEVLKYCTKMKYLDLGHNGDGGGGITDLSFVTYMPDLEVFIIAMNDVTDITPLASCHKLEYLELFTTPLSDISPLSGLSSLRHLCLWNMANLKDISPLYGLVDLERLYLGCYTPVPAEQVAEFQKNVPNCQVDTTADNTNAWKWSGADFTYYYHYYYVERYELLRKQLGYDLQEYSFYWLDEKCGDPAPAQYAGKYGKAAAGE